MVQTRRKKAAQVNKDSETPHTPPTPRGRRGRPPKKDSVSFDESIGTPGTPSEKVVGEESIVSIENDLEPEKARDESLDDENMSPPTQQDVNGVIEDIKPEIPEYREENEVRPIDELEQAKDDEPAAEVSNDSHDLQEEEANTETFASNASPKPDENIEEEAEMEEPQGVADSPKNAVSDVESEAMDLESGNSTPIKEEPESINSVAENTGDLPKTEDPPKEIDDAAERAKIMILQKFSKLDKKEEETPIILPYKAPHVFHPAAACFPKREITIPQPPQPPKFENPPPIEEGASEGPHIMGIKPIVLKAGRAPLTTNNPLVFDKPSPFGTAKPNLPPPAVVESPKLSLVQLSTQPPPPPPPTHDLDIPRQRAQSVAAKIAQKVERQKEDEVMARRREEREKRHRFRFEEDERRARDRERDKQAAIQRAKALAEQHRKEEKEQQARIRAASEKTVKEKEEKKETAEKELVVPPYEQIDECKYLIKVASKKKTESLICQCYAVGNNCSDDTCVNRAMNTECPSKCPAANCKNQRFAKRKYAAVEAFHTGTAKGCGLRALKDIKKGQFIIEYVGEMLDRDDYEKRKQKYAEDKSHKHHYLCDNGIYTIDATSLGNPSRFINHSCDPNAVCSKWAVPKTPGEVSRIGFFAKRVIKAGEEITFDYNFDNYGREAQQCFCGSENCQGWIGSLPEDYNSDGDEEEEEELVTTMELELDEEEKRLLEIDEMKGEERKSAIDDLLNDMVIRNRKYAKRVIRVVQRMEDFEQRISILENIFSQDTTLHTQSHYAKEGMTKLMYEWLTSEDNSIDSLKVKQKILQVLHGEVFVTCARDDQALINLVAEMAKEKAPTASDGQTNEEKSEQGEESPEKPFVKVEEGEVLTDLQVNLDRLREMAVRLNHHWFNRSVNFRIPKKVREPEVEERSKEFSPTRYGRDRSTYDRFDNSYRINGFSSSYRDGPKKRLSEYPENNQRKRFRRSRSRSRSLSPNGKRKRSPENTDTLHTPSASSSSSGDRISRSIASGSNTTGKDAMPRPPSKGPMPHPTQASQGGYCGYDYGAFYNSEPNQRIFFRNPPASNSAHNSHYPISSLHASRNRSYYTQYDENGVKRNQEGYRSLREMEMHYEAYNTDQLNEHLRMITDELHLIHKILARRDIAAEQQHQQQQQLIPPVIPFHPPPPHPIAMAAIPIAPIPPQIMPIQAEWPVQQQPQQQQQQPSTVVREPPPKPDRYVWARAKSDCGETYYYNKITKETQWSPPRPEQGELDPNDRTPPDTTQESSVNSTQEEKPHAATSLSVRVGELFEISAEETEAMKARESNEREFKEKMKDEKNREVLLQRLEQSRAREAEQIKRNEQKSKEFRAKLEKIIAPIVNKYVRNVKDATIERIEWLTKLVVKEMYKRESTREGFDFTLSEVSEKMIRKYTETVMDRKVKGDIWKGYKPL